MLLAVEIREYFLLLVVYSQICLVKVARQRAHERVVALSSCDLEPQLVLVVDVLFNKVVATVGFYQTVRVVRGRYGCVVDF